MEPVTITLACGDNDRTRALLDGRVRIEGCSLAPIVLPPSELFPRAFRLGAFDVAELSASTYLVQTARGTSNYVALPVFLSRSFRLDSVYVHSDSKIETPADLAGKTVGIPEYQLTLGVWVRGILEDEYGLDFRSVAYCTGGINAPGRTERVPLALPPEVHCAPAPADRSLNDLLSAGDIDALYSPSPPAAFVAGNPAVRRLFADPAEQERAYYVRAGLFPIMHLVGVRRDVAERHPWLPRAVYDAFRKARAIGLAELEAMARAPVLQLMLPWLGAEIDRTRTLMGPDPWPYGVARNQAELEALCRYAHRQHLTDRLLTPKELFDPACLTDPEPS